MLVPGETTLAGRYHLLEAIGTGGMAEVFHARDLHLQREVALKVLRQDLIVDPTFRERFLQEARAAANLVHPNIVTVYDFGQDGQHYFIVLEYVLGTDLKTLIRRRGRLPLGEALDLVVQVCSGAGYAHRAGLVHCDLKPQNILVTPDGRAKITDFGIARALASIHPEETSDIVWGSPQYFSPEQAAGRPPSPASDVYSLGVILFELLTGRLPFEGEDPLDLAQQHLTTPPPSPRALAPDIPPALEQIVLKVLAKEPSARYRTAEQLGRVLTTFVPLPVPSEAIPTRTSLPTASPDGATIPAPAAEAPAIDWVALALGLLAFLSVAGLIPLWLLVYFRSAGLP